MNIYARIYTSVDMYGIGFMFNGKPAVANVCRLRVGNPKVNCEADFYPNDIIIE